MVGTAQVGQPTGLAARCRGSQRVCTASARASRLHGDHAYSCTKRELGRGEHSVERSVTNRPWLVHFPPGGKGAAAKEDAGRGAED